MTTFLAKRRRWPMSPVALYWRRRRRVLRSSMPARIVEVRSSPLTRVSVHQHFHHTHHSRILFSHSSSTAVSATYLAAPASRVTDRIVVKRVIAARPLDAATAATPLTPRAALIAVRHSPAAATLAVPGATVSDALPRPAAMRDGLGGRTRTAMDDGPGRTRTAMPGGPGRLPLAMHDGSGRLRTAMHDGRDRLRTAMLDGPGRLRTAMHDGPDRLRTAMHDGPDRLRTATHDGPRRLRTATHDGRRRLGTARTAATRTVLEEQRVRQEFRHLTRPTHVQERRTRHALETVRLEWRKPQPASAERGTPLATRSGPAVDPARSSTGTPSTTPAQLVESAPAARRESAPAALTFDRAALDRLAENVMQRIERRVRIERERRGL